MKKKIYSGNRSTKLVISAKKIKVYNKTLKGYSYVYSLKKGYKQAKVYFHGLAGNTLSITDRKTGISLV